MTQGLSVSRLISVSVSLTAVGAQFANVNSFLIMGESDVIDTQTRIMSFNNSASVAAMFGTTAPEYLAAVAFFSQSPQPGQLYIGRWAHAPVAGRLICGQLSPAQQAMGNWTTITAGQFKIQVDAAASPVNVTCPTFAAATNLNQVATAITTGMTTASVPATCTWNGQQFVFKSNTTGVNSKVSYLTPGNASDISVQLAGTAALGARSVAGVAAETALQAVIALDQGPDYWMFFSDDASPDIVAADHQAIASYIESAANPHIYGFTTSDPNALNPTVNSDIGSILQAEGLQHTFIFWSQETPYAAESAIGRIITTNFQGSNTQMTLAYKQMPGITPDPLSNANADALNGKGYNYYSMYNNGVAIITNGWCVCSSPTANQVFIDEIYGALALANEIQTNIFNLLVEDNKVPQTDAGNHLLACQMEVALDAFVLNGYLAPGTWNSNGFGQLAQGDFLPKGYYVYTPPISSQVQSQRAARMSVPFQIAAKTAGAIQSVDVALTINP